MRKIYFILAIMIGIIFSNDLFAKNYKITKVDAIEIVHTVVPQLFEGNHTEWSDLLVGTLSVETDLGQFKAGSKLGIGQVTKIAHKFLLNELGKDKETNKKVTDLLGVEFKDINFKELEYNNKASIVATALYYKFVLERKKGFNISKQDPAVVWKKYYNTVAGAGTPAKFKEAVSRKSTVLAISEYKFKAAVEFFKELKKNINNTVEFIQKYTNNDLLIKSLVNQFSKASGLEGTSLAIELPKDKEIEELLFTFIENVDVASLDLLKKRNFNVA